MSKVITVKECLAIMDSGQPFSCLAVTYDRQRKKGGKLLEIHSARIDQKGDDPNIPIPQSPNPGQRPPTAHEAKLAALAADASSRNPNHAKWYTRNITILADGRPLTDPVKIHPPLLIEFNGIEVVP